MNYLNEQLNFTFRPTSDAFTSQVTLDIGSTFTDELEVRAILDQQLQYHSLGGIQVGPEGFTFRIFQGISIDGYRLTTLEMIDFTLKLPRLNFVICFNFPRCRELAKSLNTIQCEDLNEYRMIDVLSRN